MNEMYGTEESDFEKELGESEALRTDLKEFQELILAVRAAGRSEMVENLETEPIRSSGWNYSTVLKLAAALVIFIGATYLVNTLFFSPTETELYTRHYEPLRDFIVSPTPNQDMMKAKQTAWNEYQAGNYEKSLETLREKSDEDSDVPLIRGLDHIGLEQFTPAKAQFRIVISNNKGLIPEGNWYLSLCLLRTNEKNEAVEILTNLSTSNSKVYKTKASRLLKELE